MPDIVIVDGSFYLPALKRDASGRVSRRPHPRRGVLRHRRDRRPLQPAAAHAARRRRSSRTRSARSASATTDTIVVYDGVGPRRRAAGVVDVPPLRRQERLHPRRRLAEMEGGGPPARGRHGQARAAHLQGRAQPGAVVAVARRRAGGAWRTSPRRWSMRGRPTASAARRRSRGRACAPATCRARSTCRSTELIEDGRLIAPERIKQIFAAGGVDLDEADRSPAAARA